MGVLYRNKNYNTPFDDSNGVAESVAQLIDTIKIYSAVQYNRRF